MAGFASSRGYWPGYHEARPRFTFDRWSAPTGVGLVPIVMGIFGSLRSLLTLSRSFQRRCAQRPPLEAFLPTPEIEDRHRAPPGLCSGIFPGYPSGRGAVISSFLSMPRKEAVKHPERFGKGAVEGVAGRSLQQCGHRRSLHPLLTLGIPPNVIHGMLLGAFISMGNPGPLMMQQNPGLFWGSLVSMYIGNFMLLILNLPLIGMWVSDSQGPYKILFPDSPLLSHRRLQREQYGLRHLCHLIFDHRVFDEEV